MTEKMVSIIVPLYNGEKYVKRCLESLLEQTYGNKEILIINDGSTDNSAKLCDEVAKIHGCVNVIHTVNAGVSAARNLGIAKAAGEYLMFVDIDDGLERNTVKILVDTLEESGSDVAGCNYRNFSGEELPGKSRVIQEAGETQINAVEWEKEDAVLEWEKLSGKEYIHSGILNSDTRCWSKLYKKDKIGLTRFDTNLTIGEDMLFLLELALEGVSFVRIPYQGYDYFMNPAGAMNHLFKGSYMDQITCWKRAGKMITEALPEEENKVTAILMVSIMLVAGKLALLSNDKRKEYRSYVEECKKELRECFKVKGAFGQLSLGYQIKTVLFAVWVEGYLKLYHLNKSRHR